ncbi:hypothetical protein Poli38472_011453 [Pythium oligandrum]|uniref:FYVE-type domain-containing protein n=1 Tax=Pythium oligandrum TaxID=41045 RepID=A0A8K1FNE6_PYTOL|nr:hypothetical protein Poli38472_011453 [Pythium oligandrum]|eukprot:TMW64573.1 hypothetical protein Poli38472_011453 [Pythium oligandrum]
MRGVPISSWKPNERAIHCAICTKKFGFFRRKHHCRACGDVYCRRCLGFCLVDVPLAGVDISYTCIKCIRQHNSKPSLVDDLASLARSFDQSADTRVVRTRPDSASFVASPSSDVSTPATSPGSALTPCGSPSDWDIEYKVIVSQYHNPRLHSVCSLVGDFLECKGGAIVLMEDTHVWVIAHKGLRSRALHSGSFLSICHQAMKTNESFTASRERKQSADPSKDPTEIFRFFGVAPIRLKDQQAKPIGCIVGLDTKPRDDITAKRVQKTLENLSRLVMNLLTEEQNILRIYTSGDFKIFASNSLDSASCNMSTFQRFGVPSPTSSLGASPVSRLELARSRSYEDSTNYDDLSFFARYAPDAPSMATEKLSSSNPEPHRKLVPMKQLRSPNQSMKSA